jgi:nitrogen fixation NifU-like protein
MNLDNHIGGAQETPPHTFHPKFLQHLREPHNIGILPTADGRATGVGSCGDSVQVFLQVEDNTITDIRCDYNGCQYTLACASAMSKLARGRTIAEALELEPSDVVSELGSLPEDHLHCARLAVNTLGEAIDDFYLRHP